MLLPVILPTDLQALTLMMFVIVFTVSIDTIVKWLLAPINLPMMNWSRGGRVVTRDSPSCGAQVGWVGAAPRGNPRLEGGAVQG